MLLWVGHSGAEANGDTLPLDVGEGGCAVGDTGGVADFVAVGTCGNAVCDAVGDAGTEWVAEGGTDVTVGGSGVRVCVVVGTAVGVNLSKQVSWNPFPRTT